MKSMVKRISCLVLVALFLITFTLPFAVINVYADQKVITVFSVEDYIHEAEDETELGVLDMFKEETGIEVNYVTFATNEDMYNELIKDPYACDLMCPSEYMIMKLISEDMIRSFDTPGNFKEYGSSYIKSVFKGISVEKDQEQVYFMNQDESTSYAVGYMWGTIGLIYNKIPPKGEEITAEQLSRWGNIWTQFTDRVTIKDSIRDSYFMALAYVYEEELLTAKAEYLAGGSREAYNAKLTEIFNRTDAESVNKVEKALLDLKNNLYGFEVDAGKNDLLSGKIDVNVAWSGDAVCSIDEGLFDADGELKDDALYLGFAVPEEGSNIWFDGYVMTKNANYDNAIKFLDFISRPDVAVLNMDYTGYTSCVAGSEVFNYVLESYDSEDGTNIFDLSYFFEPGYVGDKYLIRVEDLLVDMFNAQYPTEEVIARCAVMQNFSGDDLERVNEMWKKVKLITLSDLSIVLIICVFVALILFVVVVKFREPIAKAIDKRLPKKDKKSKYKIVKVEKI